MPSDPPSWNHGYTPSKSQTSYHDCADTPRWLYAHEETASDPSTRRLTEETTSHRQRRFQNLTPWRGQHSAVRLFPLRPRLRCPDRGCKPGWDRHTLSEILEPASPSRNDANCSCHRQYRPCSNRQKPVEPGTSHPPEHLS